MIKLKRIIAVLTVVCLLAGFAALPVSASTMQIRSEGIVYVEETVYIEELLASGDPALLFPSFPSTALYPGEAFERSVVFTNTTSNAWYITMEIIDKVSTGGLDEYLDLLVTRTRNGVTDTVYSGTLEGYIPVFHNTHEAFNRVRYNSGDSATYKFYLFFSDARLLADDLSQDQINSYMGQKASFKLVFTTEEIQTILYPDPPQQPFPPGGDPAPGPSESVVSTPSVPGTVEEEPIETEFVDDPEIPLEPGALEDDIPEITGDDGDGPFVPGEVDDTDTPSGDDSPGDDVPDFWVTDTGEIVEYVEDDRIPLDEAEFLDKLPKTGENTNPLAYLMLGLIFVLAGSIIIFAAVYEPRKTITA